MTTYLPSLHGTRGVAALLVLLFHWTEIFPALSAAMRIKILNTDWDLALIMNVGWIGVTLFFVLSGFLIGRQLQTEKENERNIINFWNRRIRRIYPAYIFQLTILSTIYFFLNKRTIDSSASLFSHLTLWFDLPPFKIAPINGSWWSLTVEMGFYIAAPFLLSPKIKLSKAFIAITILATTIGWRAAVMHLNPTDDQTANLALLNSLPGSLFSFYCGVFVAHIDNYPSEGKSFILLIVSLAALYALVALLVANLDSYWKGGVLLAIWNPASSICIASCIYCLCKPSWYSRPLSASPLLWAGDLSYGIYLWHLPILLILKEYVFSLNETLTSSAAALACCLSATALMAYISFNLIESKFFRVRKTNQ